MKNTQLPGIIILFSCFFTFCGKSHGPDNGQISTSFIFSAGDSLVSYPVNRAFIQDVTNTHTTLITGQYADTSSRRGSISIRVMGDTTGLFRSDSLLVTYVDAAGHTFYNSRDSTNRVQIGRFTKGYNGIVSGSFQVKLTSASAGSLQLSNGSFTAVFQQ